MDNMNDNERMLERLRFLLPMVNPADIRDYTNKLPPEVSNLVIPLTLTHFIEMEDTKKSSQTARENREYAQIIHGLFPVYSESRILKKLVSYGSTGDRCRLLMRHILKNCGKEVKSAKEIIRSLRNTQSEMELSRDLFEVSRENNLVELIGNSENVTSDRLNADSTGCEFENHQSTSDTCETGNQSFHSEPQSLNTSGDSEVPKEEEEVQEEEDTSVIWEDAAPHVYFEVKYKDDLKLTLVSSTPTQETPFEYLNVASCSGLQSEPKIIEVPSPVGEDTIVGPQESDDIALLLNEAAENVCTKIAQEIGVENQVSESACIDESFTGIPRESAQVFVAGEPVQFQPEEPVGIVLSSTENAVNLLDYEPASKRRKTLEMAEARGESAFNLIDYLSRLTSASKRTIGDHCRGLKLDVTKKPSHAILVDLLEHFLHQDSKPPVIELDDDVYSGESDEGEEISFTELNVPTITNGAMNPVKYNERVVSRVMEIFPDADPPYLRNLCGEMSNIGSEAAMIDAMIERMLEAPEYPKRPQRAQTPEEVDIEEQVAFVIELLPDADPNFIRRSVTDLNRDDLKVFVETLLENREYPTLKDSIRKQQLSAQMRQYTTEFSVENFVKLVPNPVATFSNPTRRIPVDSEDTFFVTLVFKNLFANLYIKTVRSVLVTNKFQPYKCYTILKSQKVTMKTSRPKVQVSTIACKNIPLLQEIAFIQNEKAILEYVSKMKHEEESLRRRTKELRLMVTCNCCFDDEIMPNNTAECSKGCVFCKSCIIKSIEVAFGEGKLEFPCIGNCDAKFSLNTLQTILPPNLFSKIAQKQALAEVKAAGIENLESCPFCDFATIMHAPPETDRIFTCQNPDCLKESCRLCKETSHVPLRCDEVEKDEDVKKRVFIENKMTEALLRKCYKCGVSFFKEEGCNKMTCSCGAQMCYICKQPVTNYQHFNGMGGDRFDLCPLYSDTLAINKEDVLKGAQKAKAEVGVDKLKVDPTADVERHFNQRKKALPREPHLQILERMNNAMMNQARPNHAALQQIQQMAVAREEDPHRDDPRYPFPLFPAQPAHNGNRRHNPLDERGALGMGIANMLDQLVARRFQLQLERGRDQINNAIQQNNPAPHPRRRRHIPNNGPPIPQMNLQQRPPNHGCNCRGNNHQ